MPFLGSVPLIVLHGGAGVTDDLILTGVGLGIVVALFVLSRRGRR